MLVLSFPQCHFNSILPNSSRSESEPAWGKLLVVPLPAKHCIQPTVAMHEYTLHRLHKSENTHIFMSSVCLTCLCPDENV